MAFLVARACGREVVLVPLRFTPTACASVLLIRRGGSADRSAQRARGPGDARRPAAVPAGIMRPDSCRTEGDLLRASITAGVRAGVKVLRTPRGRPLPPVSGGSGRPSGFSRTLLGTLVSRPHFHSRTLRPCAGKMPAFPGRLRPQERRPREACLAKIPTAHMPLHRFALDGREYRGDDPPRRNPGAAGVGRANGRSPEERGAGGLASSLPERRRDRGDSDLGRGFRRRGDPEPKRAFRHRALRMGDRAVPVALGAPVTIGPSRLKPD